MENTSLERAANGIELIIQDLISEVEEQENNLDNSCLMKRLIR